MSALRIACVCNPDAARNRQLLACLRPALRALSNALYAETVSTRDYASILDTRLIESLDLLILSGGDGTLQQAMSALLACGAARFPTLALLPAGSTNVAATDIGGEGCLVKAVSALTGQLPNLKTHVKQPLRVITDTSDAPLAGFFLGLGAAPAAVARYRSIRRPVRGAPFLDAGASVVAIGGTIIEIGLRGEDWPHIVAGGVCVDNAPTGIQSSSLVLLTCLDGLFQGVSPWWDADNAPMKYLQIGLGAPSLLRSLAGILRGEPSMCVKQSAHYASGGAIRIDLPEVPDFTIDGELFRFASGPGRLSVEAGPRIEFVRLT